MSAQVTPMAERAARSGSRAGVVAAYVASFFGVLPALLWALGGRVDALAHLPSVASAVARAVGATAGVTGAAFMTWSMLSLSVRGSGLPISHLPPTTLVARGPHAWVRHPIYVGYAALFAGAGIASGSWGRGIFAAALLVAGSLVYALGFEEPRLRARFGEAYAEYARQVPAFPLAASLERVGLRVWGVVRRAAQVLANRVVLFRVGRAIFVTYGAFAGAGAGLALATCAALVRDGLTLREQLEYIVGLALWMLVWARVVALLYQVRLLVRDPREALRRVGFVSWGGYVGLFSFPPFFAWLTAGDAGWLLDRTLLGALACSCLGRIGCLTYGCCYGKPAAGGIAWTDADAKPNRERVPCASAPRVATQLLSAAYVAAAIPLVAWVANRATPGAATFVGALAYVLARFAVELLRDEPRFTRWQLTRGQLACAAGAALAMTGLLVLPASAARPLLLTGVAPLAPSVWGAIGFATLATFLVCGLHWDRVGRWGREVRP